MCIICMAYIKYIYLPSSWLTVPFSSSFISCFSNITFIIVICSYGKYFLAFKGTPTGDHWYLTYRKHLKRNILQNITTQDTAIEAHTSLFAIWKSPTERFSSILARRAAVRRPRVRISAWHPSGDPLPELAAMKKLERNAADFMNECVWMKLYECTENNDEN